MLFKSLPYMAGGTRYFATFFLKLFIPTFDINLIQFLGSTRDVGRTREEYVNHEPQASDLRILPTSQVVYQPINHRNL